MKKITFVSIVLILFCLYITYTVFAAATAPVNPTVETLGIDTMGSLSISLVNQDPDPVIAGGIVELRFGAINVGGQPINNAIIEIVPEFPFELISGDSGIIKAGTLQGYQGVYNVNKNDMKIVKTKIKIAKEATAGTYELKLKYYEEGSDVSVTKSLSIAVKSSESAEVIHIDKTSLVPGEQSSLRFRITNVGNAPLKDLSFNWENTESIILPVGSDNTRYIKYVEMGEFADLDYQVIADTNAKPGLYKLNLHLSYDDGAGSGQTKAINTMAGVYVGGGTDFEVAFAESTNGATSFSIANIGSNPASSVSVKIPTQNGWRVSGSNSVIIGNLNKGDYTIATFKLQSATAYAANAQTGTGTNTQTGTGTNTNGFQGRQRTANETSSSNLKITLSYTDTMGVRKEFEKEIVIDPRTITTSTDTTTAGTTLNGRRITTQQSFFTTYQNYIILLAVLAVGYFVYSKYRKKKLLNPNFKWKDLFKQK